MAKKKHDPFCGKLFALVLPIAVQNLLSALVSASDALMLGLLDHAPLAAVSLATQVQFVLNLFFAVLTIGSGVLAAQYWDKGDRDAVENVLMTALRSSVLVSAVFFLAANFYPAALMRLLTNEPELIALGVPYLRAASWSYLFMGVSQIYLCIMKNSGRTLRSTLYGSSALVLNLVFNALLIFGLLGLPRLEITGAALATSLARAVELVLVLAENFRPEVVRIRFHRRTDQRKELRQDFWKYSLPVLGNELIWGGGVTTFTAIMGRLGEDAVAANSIANIVLNVVACVCLGIGTGSGIIVGNELGRGELALARNYGERLYRTSLVSGIASGAVVLAASPLLIRLVPQMRDTARKYLWGMLLICALYMVGKALNSTTVGGIFCAGGDTRFGLLCDTVTTWAVVIPAGLMAAFVLKLPVLTDMLGAGEKIWVEPPFYFCYGTHIYIGEGSYLNFNCNFVDDGKITIGKAVMFGPAVTIATVGHPIRPDMRGYMYTAPVTIEDNCWIGGGAIICPGVTIGENTVIGAGSVVTQDIPANSVAVGNPCRVLREIGPEDYAFYFRDRRIDKDDLAEEAELRKNP